MSKKILALLLACLMVLPLAACAGGTDKPAADTTTAAPDNTDPEETTDDFYADRNNAKDSLPDNLDFGDADIRILSHKINESGGSNIPEIEFFTDEEGVTTNVITSAVLRRNAVVEDRLKIKMVILNDGTSYDNIDKVRTSIMSFSDDYDLYVLPHGTVPNMASEGFLLDLSVVEYLDFEKPWWNSSFIDSTMVDGRIFATTGELSISLLANNFLTFFNKSLWADFHGDEDLYQIVRDGNFTLDKFAELCSTLYRDLNGDGVADVDDQYGNIHPWETASSDAFVPGSNLHFFDYDEDNETYYFSFGDDHDMDFVEKLRAIWFKNNNSYNSENNEMDQDYQLMAKLKNDTALFTSAKMCNVDLLRDMDSDFGIVPIPKFDEAQEGYHTMPTTGFTVFSILTSAPAPDMIGAFLEAACSENYRYVTPAYFDNAVKYGYTRDEESAEMLDVCVSGIYLPLEFAYHFGGANLIATYCNTEKSLNMLTSIINKHRKEWESGINDTMDAIRAIV